MGLDLEVTPEILAVFQRRFERRLAKALIGALEESDMTVEDVAERMGMTVGKIERLILKLVHGRARAMSDQVAIGVALGIEFMPMLGVPIPEGEEEGDW